MIQLNVKLINLNAVKSLLKGWEKQIGQRLQLARHKAGKKVLKDAKKFTPRDSGRLERSLKYRILKKRDIEIYVSGHSRAGKYAEYVHDGRYKLGRRSQSKGSGVGPQFITRAIDKNEQTIATILKKAFIRS